MPGPFRIPLTIPNLRANDRSRRLDASTSASDLKLFRILPGVEGDRHEATEDKSAEDQAACHAASECQSGAEGHCSRREEHDQSDRQEIRRSYEIAEAAVVRVIPTSTGIVDNQEKDRRENRKRDGDERCAKQAPGNSHGSKYPASSLKGFLFARIVFERQR